MWFWKLNSFLKTLNLPLNNKEIRRRIRLFLFQTSTSLGGKYFESWHVLFPLNNSKGPQHVPIQGSGILSQVDN